MIIYCFANAIVEKVMETEVVSNYKTFYLCQKKKIKMPHDSLHYLTESCLMTVKRN